MLKHAHPEAATKNRLVILAVISGVIAALVFASSRRSRGTRDESVPAAPLAAVRMTVGDHAPDIDITDEATSEAVVPPA